jgi:hypothetical protein
MLKQPDPTLHKTTLFSISEFGLSKHKPLVAATLDWLKCASPKLIPPEDRPAIGGGMI